MPVRPTREVNAKFPLLFCCSDYLTWPSNIVVLFTRVLGALLIRTLASCKYFARPRLNASTPVCSGHSSNFPQDNGFFSAKSSAVKNRCPSGPMRAGPAANCARKLPLNARHCVYVWQRILFIERSVITRNVAAQRSYRFVCLNPPPLPRPPLSLYRRDCNMRDAPAAAAAGDERTTDIEYTIADLRRMVNAPSLTPSGTAVADICLLLPIKFQRLAGFRPASRDVRKHHATISGLGGGRDRINYNGVERLTPHYSLLDADTWSRSRKLRKCIDAPASGRLDAVHVFRRYDFRIIWTLGRHS